MIMWNLNILKKEKLCYMNTDSVYVYIKKYDIYKDISNYD